MKSCIDSSPKAATFSLSLLTPPPPISLHHHPFHRSPAENGHTLVPPPISLHHHPFHRSPAENGHTLVPHQSPTTVTLSSSSYNSIMFTSNEGAVAEAAMNSRKRKMKEVAAEPSTEPTPAAAAPQQFNNLFNLPSQQQLQFAASPNVSQVQQILNNAAGPFRPFGSQFKPLSFTSLLTAPDDELQEMIHTQHINQIITHHSENLKHALTGMMENHRHVAEERAAKKLKEKEEEMQRKLNETAYLEQLVELYKGESERLQIRVRCLERTTMSLRASLEEARAEMEEEDAESSFEDPGRVSPVMLDCKVCERQLARVMIWPCRHVCVCKGCEPATRVCPVCRSLKTTSVEVCLPLD